jgi:hypothetical protein
VGCGVCVGVGGVCWGGGGCGVCVRGVALCYRFI